MKLIIGLSNPGKKYENTRHNLGFFIIEKFWGKFKENFSDFQFEKRFNAKIAIGLINNEKVALILPQTFMNNSGQAVLSLIQFYKLNPERNILIIYDDIDLPIEKIRTRGESAGGHKGMDSIINTLGTKKIPRIRCGILGKPKKEIKDTAAYVLQKFNAEDEKIILEKTLPMAITEIEKFLK